jgi:hypothetical protein
VYWESKQQDVKSSPDNLTGETTALLTKAMSDRSNLTTEGMSARSAAMLRLGGGAGGEG